MKKNSILLYLVFFAISLQAQDFKLSQTIFYRDAMNPASFIQNNDFNAFLLYNNEFTGFEQHPNTQVADFSALRNNYKLGLSINNDIIGYDKAQQVKLRVAKQFALSEKSFFSLGLAAGVINHKLEATKMTFYDDEDPMSYVDYSYTNPDFDFGVEFQLDKLFTGFSVNHLGKQIASPENINPVTHYYGYAQYVVNANNPLRYYPNVLFRMWKGELYGEAGLTTFYKNKVWVGFTYSNGQDLIVNAGMRITSNIMFGYAFKTNMNTKILEPGNINTHEIFLNFAINRNNGNIKSVRFID